MKQGMNSIKDLQEGVLAALADMEWHSTPELMDKIGETIIHERALRFYKSMNRRRQEGAAVESRSQGECIRSGKRRGLYLAIKSLQGKGLLDIRNDSDFDSSEIKFKSTQTILDETEKAAPTPPQLAYKQGRSDERFDILKKLIMAYADAADSPQVARMLSDDLVREQGNNKARIDCLEYLSFANQYFQSSNADEDSRMFWDCLMRLAKKLAIETDFPKESKS